MGTEPNTDKAESVGEIFDKLTAGEQPQESSPVTEQVETQPEGGSDPLTTPSKVESADKGFASHPVWIERENKYKEAKELLKQRDSEREQYSKLLDDPQVYAVWLKQQGYSDAHIRQALADKGYQTPQNQQETDKSNQAIAIAEKACKELGWDINRLDEQQKSYINDSVNLTMKVIEQTIGPMLDKRFGPIEQMSNEMNQQKQFQTDDARVRSISQEEFPGISWEEVIQPAISKFLKELDIKDPKRTEKMSYDDMYYRATRPLLREFEVSKGRQEVRDMNKRNARPLGTGVSSKAGEPAAKGKDPRQELESILDAKGIR